MKAIRAIPQKLAAFPVDHLPSRYISMANSIFALRFTSASVSPKLRVNSAGISSVTVLMLDKV
jgi:hypothetical protein